MDKIYQKKNPDIKNAAKGKFDAFAATASVTKERLGCQVKTCRHDGMDKAAERLIFPIKTLGNDQEDVIRKCCNSRSRCFLVQKGFTLIELLVVVLIIGILAAIALPQYRTVVLKSRYSEMVQAVHALKNAEEVFFMTTGAYTTDINLLDISFPVTGYADNTGYHIASKFHCSVTIGEWPQYSLGCWRGSPYMGYTISLDKALPFRIKYCFADKTSFQLCSSMGGTNPVEYNTGKWRFLLD